MSERIDGLHPYYQPIVREILVRAPKRGLYPFITQGRRSRELQACIYARGRVAAGKSASYDGLPVHTFLSKDRKLVIARCGQAEYSAPIGDWKNVVTKVLWSWHIVGFAVDFSFRSAADKKDDIIPALERAKKWSEIALLYNELAKVAREIAPGIRHGNDWNQNGIPIDEDPREKGSFVDLPHFEWHPGKTLDQVRAGILPAYPKQCPECRNFPAAFVNDRCDACCNVGGAR